MAQRANVLRIYRELIDLIKRLPTERREASLREAREAVKANVNETDPLKASDMLKDLVARVSFLRMATPKTYRDRCVHPLIFSGSHSSGLHHLGLFTSPKVVYADGRDTVLRLMS